MKTKWVRIQKYVTESICTEYVQKYTTFVQELLL